MTHSKITFSSNNNSIFLKEIREKVKTYFETTNTSQYGNYQIIIKTVFMLSLYFIPYFLMIFGIVTSIWALIICWSLMGFGIAGVGMSVMHDANHRSFSKNKKMNKFIGKSLYLLGGFPATWRYQHNNLHHSFTNVDGYDEDIAPIGILRFSPHKPLLKIHRIQHWYAWFFYGLMTLSWCTNKDFVQLYKYSKQSPKLNTNTSITRLFTDLIFSKILYYAIFIVIPFFTIAMPWYVIIGLFLGMHFISGFILAIIFQTAHVMPNSEYSLPNSEGIIEHDIAVHQLLNTTDYSPKSRIFSWFVGGLNYQIEHHLFPSVSHIHYKKISPIVKETAHKYNIPYNIENNFIKALWSHVKMLKSLGRLTPTN